MHRSVEVYISLMYNGFMRISVIIPTKNEEKLLPKLLRSLQLQDFNNFEVIVADAFSTDRTREIAAEYGARVVDGGMPGEGRNAGARAADGDILVFLDADVIVPPHFLMNVHTEMQERYIDVATCAIHPLSDYQIDRIIHKLINLTILANLRVDPKAFGFCIFITKRLFDRIGGFDETIKVAEDNDLVKRASEFRHLRYLSSTFVNVSVRRFEKEGRLQYVAKGIGLNIYRMFRGEIRHGNNIVEYTFGGYDSSREQRKALDKLERGLKTLEKTQRAKLAKIRHLRSPSAEKEERTRLLSQLKTAVGDYLKHQPSGKDKD